MTPSRGQVYMVDFGSGPTPWLVVSNDARNRHLCNVLAVRIGASVDDPGIPTVVPLISGDPILGAVLVDDVVHIYKRELSDPVGEVSKRTLRAVSVAMRIAIP